MWKWIESSGIIAVLMAFLVLAAEAKEASARREAADLKGVKALIPGRRIAPSPTDGKRVSVNPPPLLWPVRRGRDVRYAVRLFLGPEFRGVETREAEGLRWALFNPHRKLRPGTWGWQYGVSKAGAAPAWSDTMWFEVPDTARAFATPTAAEMARACPKGHPRLPATAGELGAFRERMAGSAELARFVRQSNRYLGKVLREDAEPPKVGADEKQARVFRRLASKALAGRISRSIQWLVPVYLMTGDERYGREAVRRALWVAEWDPDGFTSPKASDFADGSCMRAMALTYDTCFDLLSEEERGMLREAMAYRAERFFESRVNNLESRAFNAHIWQHILMEFAEVAFATLHEIPEAEAWASYVYELWLARFPLMGGADGGWANGSNYFGSNIETLLMLPSLLGRMSGADLFDVPWYRNAADFLIYTWPPQSAPDGFGDGTEQRSRPPDSRLTFTEFLGREFENPYALWYVQKWLEGRGRGLRMSPMLALQRLRWQEAEVEPRPPRDLAQSKVFRDVGIVSMHTDLVDASRDLMIGFRSSPYGAFNHAHACQNSFNVLFGGERLFHNSGYYISYGDDHFKGWYKHTRGHNSVLVDGRGQTFNTEGYGWIARFLDGERIGYCLGDASNAYGDAGLTRFRRHLALLRPSTIVIYDDLRADHPAAWGWLLHSGREMTADAKAQRLRVQTGTARAQVDIMGSGPLQVAVDDRFDPPALNWRKKKIGGEIPEAFPGQWHATVSPAEPSEGMRFLAVVQVRAAEDTSAFDDPVADGEGLLRVGGWIIQAEMDASRKASMVVRHRDGGVAMGTDVPEITVGGERHETGLPGASILIEVSDGVAREQRCVDELPEVAR